MENDANDQIAQEFNEHTIYGDGTMTVVVTAHDLDFISSNNDVVSMSREAFREVVIGWTRLLEQEAEAKR